MGGGGQAMKLQARSAVIPSHKRDYVLALKHPDGRAKAEMGLLGYSQAEFQQLEADLREQILIPAEKP